MKFHTTIERGGKTATAIRVPDEVVEALGSGKRPNRSWHVLSIKGAKTDETRQRRIAKSVATLREGRVR